MRDVLQHCCSTCSLCWEKTTIAQIIVSENVENPDYVTVTVNDEFVDSDAFATTELKDGDTVEFLYFMGGGSF